MCRQSGPPSPMCHALALTLPLLLLGPAGCAQPPSSGAPAVPVGQDALALDVADTGPGAAADVAGQPDAGVDVADAAPACKAGDPATCTDDYKGLKVCDTATGQWKVLACVGYCLIDKSVSHCDELKDVGSTVDAGPPDAGSVDTGPAVDTGPFTKNAAAIVYNRVLLQQKTANVFMVSSDGTGAKQLLGDAVVLSQPHAGRMVVIANGFKSKSHKLKVVTLAGADVAVVAGANQQPVFGVLSHDGKRLAWTERKAFDSNDTILHVRDLATGADKLLSLTPTWETRPAFSPDGKHLAVYGKDAKLYLANADGSGEKVVLTGAFDDNDDFSGLSWTADAKTLVATMAAGTSGAPGVGFGLLQVATSKLDKLLMSAGMRIAPAVTNDGAFIYFSLAVKGQSAAVRRVEVASGKVQTLTDGQGYDFLPMPSPDGKQITYNRLTNDVIGELRVLDVATGSIKPLHTPAYSRGYWVQQ